jgi:F-type H+-transporting ATPase subunit a
VSTRQIGSRLLTLSTREVVGLVLSINAVVVVLAFLTGNLPSWPPGPDDIHVPEQTGAPLIRIWGDEISISNSLFTMWLVMAVLIAFAWFVARDLREIPGPRQNFVEMLVQALKDFMQSAGGPRVVRYLDLFGTLFLFLLLANWLSVVPLVGQIELLHSPTADYHTNFGLAVTAFVWYQAIGIGNFKLGYFTRWLNFTGFRDGILVGVVLFFVGILELFSELFRMLTLTLRLWGNIWGGEITLAVIYALLLVPSLPFPFIGLEIFIGFIQAFIFAFLVLLYIILALESHGEEHSERLDETHGQLDQAQSQREVAHA